MKDYLSRQFYGPNDKFISPKMVTSDGEFQINDEEVWTKIYHKFYGLCYVMDIRKDKKLKIANGPVTLKLQEDKYKNEQPFALLHNSMDYRITSKTPLSFR